MIDELQSLAALASARPDVEVRIGESECLWSFNWSTRTITANPVDLALRPPDFCRGLILHESAHAALTRIGDIVPRDLFQARLHPLLNVVEDCRIENWLQLRFPGCRPWIRLYNDRIFGAPSDEAAASLASDPAGGFLAGLLDRWWNGKPMLGLHPESEQAIAEVWPYFLEAAAAYPDPDAPDSRVAAAAYERHPVSICYRARDLESGPPASECLVRIMQHRMWLITWRHIVPVFLRLLEHPDSGPTRERISRLESESTSVHSPPGSASHGLPGVGVSRGKAASASRLVRGRAGQPGRHNCKSGDAGDGLARGFAGDYAAAAARHARLIESCSAILLRYLTADSRPKLSRYHRSGCSLDLKVAMQFEADPRQYERLWQRVTLPSRPDPAMVILVDGSGSMRGEKAEATFAALVVLREVCLRLGIPLAIIRFDNGSELIQSHDLPEAPGVVSGLAGILSPQGGTEMLPALRMARTILDALPHRHRFLWVLSDGGTNRADEAAQAIARIRQGGVKVHGLGLGLDSEEIRMLIPGSPVGLAASQLPGAFASLLRSDVTAGGW